MLGLGLLASLFSANSYAWGSTGHAVICQLAWLQLSEATKDWLRPLYQAKGYDSFAQSCNWADHIKSQDRYDYLKPLHYVNVPPAARSYNPNLAICGQQSCITHAINHYQKKLAQGKVNNVAEAVLLLSHLVGDIHQPMHVSYAHDWGGNKKKLRVPGESKVQNLHWLWDVWLVEQAGLTAEPPKAANQAAQALLNTISAKQMRQWRQSDDVHTWAKESYRYTVTIYKEYSPNARYGPSYVRRHKAFVSQRIQQAGVRLAQRLNQLTD